ncbi:MAG: spore germination protein [Bacillales bacterium]|nr:spore germination protein [Bacillales bacterium]
METHYLGSGVVLDKFTSKHLAIIILGVSVVALKTYPRIYLEDGGRESWVGMIVASIIMTIFYMYIFNISENNDRPKINEVYQTVLGKNWGTFFLLLFIGTLFLTLVECASVEAASMHENMLLETPKWFFLVFFIIPLIYVLLKDIVAIISVSKVIIILIILLGINLAILTAKYKNYDYLFPIFPEGIHFGFILSIIKMVAFYGSISIVLPFQYKFGVTKKKMMIWSFIVLLFLAQMQIVNVTGMIATFEIDRLIAQTFPKLIQTQLITYYEFIEFGELYVMIQVLGGWTIKYLVTFYGILLILRGLEVRVKYLKSIVFLISALVYAASYYASKTILDLFFLLNIYTYICLVNFIILPLIIYTIYNIKQKTLTKRNA